MKYWLGIIILCVSSTYASDWSFTKILTVNHVGSPSDNDGIRKASFILEKHINTNRYIMVGVTENSEARNGLTLGYSKHKDRSAKLQTTCNLYLSSNYKKLPYIMPIPTVEVRYIIAPRVRLIAEAIPVPDPHAYILVLTGINISF